MCLVVHNEQCGLHQAAHVPVVLFVFPAQLVLQMKMNEHIYFCKKFTISIVCKFAKKMVKFFMVNRFFR